MCDPLADCSLQLAPGNTRDTYKPAKSRALRMPKLVLGSLFPLNAQLMAVEDSFICPLSLMESHCVNEQDFCPWSPSTDGRWLPVLLRCREEPGRRFQEMQLQLTWAITSLPVSDIH